MREIQKLSLCPTNELDFIICNEYLKSIEVDYGVGNVMCLTGGGPQNDVEYLRGCPLEFEEMGLKSSFYVKRQGYTRTGCDACIPSTQPRKNEF